MTVHLLWHVHVFSEDDESSKLIGVYSSLAAAEAARERASKLPGFCDAPDGFVIDPYEIDRDYWPEGYVTL